MYYQPKPISPRDQMLMNRIDRLHLELPFAGARMLRDLLRQEGHKVGRSKVARLMRLMGIEALYRKPKTTKSTRTCMPTTRSRPPEQVWTATSGSTTPVALTAALTDRPRIRFISKRRQYPWQLKPKAGIHL